MEGRISLCNLKYRRFRTVIGGHIFLLKLTASERFCLHPDYPLIITYHPVYNYTQGDTYKTKQKYLAINNERHHLPTAC
jgi:hypothetical protein